MTFAQILKSLTIDELSEMFGDIVQEIADRTGSGDRVMYDLARNFWANVADEELPGE